MVRASGYSAASLRAWARLSLDSPLPLAEAVRAGRSWSWTARPIGARATGARAHARHRAQRLVGGRAAPRRRTPLGALALSFPHETPWARTSSPSSRPSRASARSRWNGRGCTRRSARPGARGPRRPIEARLPRRDVARAAHAPQCHRRPCAPRRRGIHGPVTEKQRASLRRILRAQRRLVAVIDDVLRYATLGAAGAGYPLRVIEVGGMVSAVVASLGGDARARASRSRRRGLRRVACFVWADGGRLGTSWDISWATRSSSRRVVAASSWRRVGPGRPGSLDIQVRDTGIGIPADQLEAVFDPFTQVDSSRTRPFEGTGLGLTIARELARGMGGDITVESVGTEGATFTLGSVAPSMPRTCRRTGGVRPAGDARTGARRPIGAARPRDVARGAAQRDRRPAPTRRSRARCRSARAVTPRCAATPRRGLRVGISRSST